MSPPDFDDLVRQFETTCQWYSAAAQGLPARIEQPFPDLRLPDGPVGVTERSLIESADYIRSLYEQYEGSRSEHLELERQTGNTAAEYALMISTPLLVSLALALRITKVTGELRLGQN